MKRKPLPNEKILIEFDSRHLPVLVTALETYSRLRSGQIDMAMDEVYYDRSLSWEERRSIESFVRSVAFPPNPEVKLTNDGHGGFYDQYGNSYDENGKPEKESEEYKAIKSRPHLNHPNSSFGVGCKEMKEGTIAWEIKKAIQEYLHYQRNDGYRDMGVDGDGALILSGIPSAKIIDQKTKEHWVPSKSFLIPKRYQAKVHDAVVNKRWGEAWDTVSKSFKKNPLPMGSSARITVKDSSYFVTIEKPVKPKICTQK